MLDNVHMISEQQILIFLLQVLLLLGCARSLGLLFMKFGQPSITAEILVGILFGPTVLGRVAPGLHAALFPAEAMQQAMLQSVAWLGILFFLLDTGLETDFATAWRQRGDGLRISLADLVLPMIIAFVPVVMLPARFLGDPNQRILFACFVATIMTISALPVTARVLQDLNLYRTDAGLLVMCALTINDVAGWLVFAIILGLAGEAIVSPTAIPLILIATVAFATLALTVGRRATNAALERFHAWGLPEPGTSLTFICLIGLLGGVFTSWIGIHALFGFFIVGIMAGEARALSENTRQVMSQMVRAILVPLFFATIGLKIDFAANFHPGLVALLLFVGVGGRFFGAWVGCAWARQPRRHWHWIAAAHTPGGEMQIVIGMLALEYGVVSEPVYVAIIFGAVASSAALGPWMRWAIRATQTVPVRHGLPPDVVLPNLVAESRDVALRALCRAAARVLPGWDAEALYAAVAARESAMGTALGNGIAVPHARLPALRRAVVVAARTHAGIDWNAPDAVPARLLFLILTPADDTDQQIRIVGTLATALQDPGTYQRLIDAQQEADFTRALMQGIGPTSKPLVSL